MEELVIIEDNELEEFHNAICKMQIVFNAVHAPNGTIDVTKFYEITKNKNVFIIVDNNLMQLVGKLIKRKYQSWKSNYQLKLMEHRTMILWKII